MRKLRRGERDQLTFKDWLERKKDIFPFLQEQKGEYYRKNEIYVKRKERELNDILQISRKNKSKTNKKIKTIKLTNTINKKSNK